MATLIASSDDKTNNDGQGYVRPTPNTTYLTAHNEAGSFRTNYNQYHSVGQRYNQSADGKYRIHRAVMRFDLTNLPSSASVFVAVMTILAGSQVFHYTDWDFVLVDGSDCTDPLVKEDYGDLLDETTSLGSIAVADITGSATFEITLNAAGRAFLESKAGSVAVFGVRSSDDISSTAPTGDHNAGEKTEMNFAIISLTNYPYITITYDLLEPTVSTEPATSVEETTATLNGTLDDDGGEACDCGFEWGETEEYGNTTSIESKETGETFSQAISGLTPGQHYHFRAIANNSAGTSYGSDRAFFAKGGKKGNPHIDQRIYQHVERMGI